jgi:hypothetical protein
MTKSLCFITPVWKRYELTEIVLKSRRRVCDELANHNISASSVIIGDDDNLDIARSLGFAVVERDNEFLSRKFNDGYEYAFDNAFDYCYPVGSDSILTADQFIHNVGRDTPIASHYYTMIHASGMERIDVQIKVPGGIGPLIIPVPMLRKFPRPIPEDMRRGCDNAARQTILRADIVIETREEHQWEHVAFQSGITQITDYERIRRVYQAEVFDVDNGVFPEISARYDSDTCDGIREYYASGRAENA